MRQKIEALIDENIRPLVQADGGRVDLISAEDNKIVIRLTGMCSGCPGSAYTTTRLIAPVLRKALGDTISIQFELGPSCSPQGK